MKYMGGWSWDDYCAAPTDLIDDIITLINEEQDEIERIRNSR